MASFVLFVLEEVKDLSTLSIERYWKRSSELRTSFCVTYSARRQFVAARFVKTLNAKAHCLDAHRYAQSDNMYQICEYKIASRGTNYAKLFQNMCTSPFHIFFFHSLKPSQRPPSSPISPIPSRRNVRHQPLPRLLRLHLKQLPLHNPTPAINI